MHWTTLKTFYDSQAQRRCIGHGHERTTTVRQWVLSSDCGLRLSTALRHYVRGQCQTQRGLFLFGTWRATCRPMSALTTRRRERWCHRSRWMVIEYWQYDFWMQNIIWHISLVRSETGMYEHNIASTQK